MPPPSNPSHISVFHKGGDEDGEGRKPHRSLERSVGSLGKILLKHYGSLDRSTAHNADEEAAAVGLGGESWSKESWSQRGGRWRAEAAKNRETWG